MSTAPPTPIGMCYVSVVPLEKSGVIEFQAWVKTAWLGIWQKPWNERTTIPHLVFFDCPTEKQVTWRFLILDGQAQMPIDPEEEWRPLGLPVWQTRRSFSSIWISNACYSKKVDLPRGKLVARDVEKKVMAKPSIAAPEEDVAFAP